MQKTVEKRETATVGHMRDVAESVNQCIRLFGCTAEFSEEFRRRVLEIVETYSDELNMPQEMLLFLPERSELPPRTTEHFKDLVTWLRNLGPSSLQLSDIPV